MIGRPRVPVSLLVGLALLLGSVRLSTEAGMPAESSDMQPQAPSAARATPTVRILAPAEGAIVSGLTRLKAGVEPAHLASRVVFLVDGREICAITRQPFECEWDAGSVISERQVRVAVNLAGGGRVVRTVRTRGAAFAEQVDVDVVQVTVSVMDERGQFVRGLPRSAFHVSEDDRPQPISHFYSENIPLELLVAVDMSGSMAPALPMLKQAVSGFLAAVPPDHHVTLVGFNSDLFKLIRNKVDPGERIKAVNSLRSWGTTILYDAVLGGIDMLGNQPGRKALIVFTDGEDQGSYATVEEVEANLQASDLTLYMIGQGRGVTSQPLRRVMEQLTLHTGGRALFTERIDRLTDAFNDLINELSHQYVLGYQPTNSARDETWRRITVTVDGHDRVRARQGYRAPSERRTKN